MSSAFLSAVNQKKDSENTPVKGGTVADLGEYFTCDLLQAWMWWVYVYTYTLSKEMQMITFILFAVLDDHEDDSVVSGGKVMSLYTLIHICSGPLNLHCYICISDAEHLVTTVIVFFFFTYKLFFVIDWKYDFSAKHL